MGSQSHSSWRERAPLTADDATISARDVNAQLTFPSAPHYRPVLPQSFKIRNHHANNNGAAVAFSHNQAPNGRHPPLNPYSPYATSPYLSNMPHSPFVAINDSKAASDLADHHGPPVPLTRNNSSATDQYYEETELVESFGPSSLLSNYLDMLSQKPDDHVEQESCPVGLVTTPETNASQVVSNGTSSGFQPNLDAMCQYLTSPFEDDSPFDDFLQTPVDNNALTSPEVADYGDTFPDFPLFSNSLRKTIDPPSTISPPNLNLDELYIMPPEESANTDEQTSLYKSPPSPTPARRRVTSATGVRKNVKPDALIPIDAPTQPRKYHTPSATSRKEVPIAFARKRARSQAFGDDDDELANEEAASNTPAPTESELIEAKRRQNTIAARKSRKRKLEYVLELEEAVKHLTRERDEWRSRCLMGETVLKHHGLDSPWSAKSST